MTARECFFPAATLISIYRNKRNKIAFNFHRLMLENEMRILFSDFFKMQYSTIHAI